MKKFLFLGLLVLVGCGGGNNSTPPVNPQQQQFTVTSGNWDLSGSDQGGAFIVGGNLTQSGKALTGVFHAANSPCYDLALDIPVSGTATASNATVTSSSVQSQVISATLSGGAASVTGTFSITGGCAAGSVGTFNGALVPSLSGTWTGSFTSVNGPPVVTATANLTQTALADADGLFSLSGTAALTNSACFTSSTVAVSAVVGRVVLLSLTNNDGSTTSFAGTLTAPGTAKQITGNYSVSGGACAGDTGSGTLSRP
jgi:hypothetical protein